MKDNTKFFLDLILISIISLVQSLSLVVFNGVKPNLVLAALIVLIFYERSLGSYLILVFVSLAFLNYSALISKEVAVFGLLMLSAFYFKKYLSENLFLYSFFLTAILTSLFYLIIDPKFIFYNFNIFSLELMYNVVASLIFGYLYQIGYESRT